MQYLYIILYVCVCNVMRIPKLLLTIFTFIGLTFSQSHGISLKLFSFILIIIPTCL